MIESLIGSMSQGFREAPWKDVTTIHPIGLTAVLILGVVMLLLPRRWSVFPMLIIACFISTAQRIVILNLDFNLLRIMVVFGAIRLLIYKEYLNFQWKTLDKLLLLYAASSTLILTIQAGSFGTFINRLGFSFDTLGTYFLFRCLIRNWVDIDKLIIGSVIISVFVMFAFALEFKTQRNVFSVFGGVPEFTGIRDGKLRCQGAFMHPILAGCFWAALMPLFVAQWWKKNGKFLVIIGITTSTFIIFTCHSSTPVFGFICVIIGGLMFPLRNNMRLVRWGIIFSLSALHFIMNAPVWALISRASAVGGGTGWHRFILLDNFIRGFTEWFLIGMRSTAHWSRSATDITNEYVLVGVRGGALTLGLFLAVIVLAYRGVGRIWRLNADDKYRMILAWSLGVSLFVHTMCFFGVSYFGQIYIVWYLLLAMIGTLDPVSKDAHVNTPIVIQDLNKHRNLVVKKTKLNGAIRSYVK